MITKEKVLEILEQNSILSRIAGRVVIYEPDWENIADEIVKNCSIPDVVRQREQLMDKKVKDLVNLAKSELSNENKMKVMKLQTEQDKRYIKLLKKIVDLQTLDVVDQSDNLTLCNKCENGLIWSKDRLKAKSCDCGK